MSVDGQQPQYVAAPAQPAPVKALWICLVLAWVFLILPIPFTVFIGSPLALAALILAIICLGRGAVGHGVMGLIGSIVVAPIAYFIGLALMTLVFAAAGAAGGPM